MGEGIGNITQDAHVAALAAQASDDIKKTKEKEAKKKVTVGPGLMLEQMPKAAEANLAIQEAVPGMHEVIGPDATEAAENILTEMDKELDNIQKGLKDFIAKKIRLAAHNSDPVKYKKLLVSAYNDTKKAYDKIKKVREQLT